jgi:hypothetical protein
VERSARDWPKLEIPPDIARIGIAVGANKEKRLSLVQLLALLGRRSLRMGLEPVVCVRKDAVKEADVWMLLRILKQIELKFHRTWEIKVL